MAYSNANLPAADVLLAAADKPLALARNWLRTLSDARWNQVGTIATADDSHADGPATYGYDEFDNHQTYPASAQNTWYYVIDFGASGLAVVDGIGILNHNLGSEGATCALQFDANQNDAWSSVHTAATQTPAANDDKRLVYLDLDHGAVGTAQRYEDVRYARLKFTGTGIQPKFGELVVSRRRQLERNPNRPRDPNQLTGSQSVFEGSTGIMSAYTYYKGRRKLIDIINPDEASYIADWEALFEDDTDFGTLPFLWIENPNSAPTDANWMRFVNPDLIGPRRSVSDRNFVINAIEQGPNFLKLGT